MFKLGKYRKVNVINIIVPSLVIILVALYFIGAYRTSFDENIFDENKAYKHIQELSSPKYNGRLAGGEGNKLTLQYIEEHFKKFEIEPLGENDTYYQYFDTMITHIDSNPYFAIQNNDGEVIEEFKMFEDYKFFTYWYGGGGRFEGDIIFVDNSLYDVPVELLKNKLVVMGTFDIRIKDVEYVIENQGKGILFRRTSPYDRNDRELQVQKKVENTIKKGKSLFFGYLGSDAYSKIKHHSSHDLINKDMLTEVNLLKSVGIVKNVMLKCDISYPVVKTANILGKIDGKEKDKFLIIGANIDHVGKGIDGKYFPGALNNASGTGMMLELARTIKLQKNLPDRTIIFAGWNARENVAAGSQYYVENPLKPLEKTRVINLDCIGNTVDNDIRFEAKGEAGEILRNKIFQYAEDLKDTKNLQIEPMQSEVGRWSDHMPFIEADVPAINIIDGSLNLYTYKDNMDNISKEKLERIGVVITNYIKRDVFKDTIADYLNNIEITIIVLFLLGILFIYMIFSLYKTNEGLKLLNVYIEDIYYSSGFNILLKCFYFITPAFIILFSLVFIANLPQNFNMVLHNNELYTNFSMYLTLKKSIIYIRDLLLNGFGMSENNVEIFRVVLNSTRKSVKLLSFTIVITLILGIAKGIFDSYKDGRRGNLRTVGTLMAFSLPDVFIVLCSMLLISYISYSDMLKQLVDLSKLKGFFIPLLTLSIIPTVYTSRITFIVVQEEIKKGYVIAAKGKGLSKFDIFTKHILKSVVIKVVDSIPTLITIIISNLIIVEYLLDYRGIVFNLYRFYKQNDINSFIGLSIALGLIYITFIVFAKLLSRFINPKKREGVH